MLYVECLATTVDAVCLILAATVNAVCLILAATFDAVCLILAATVDDNGFVFSFGLYKVGCSLSHCTTNFCL